MYFNLKKLEKCGICKAPVAGRIFQHQCRSLSRPGGVNTQPLCCYTCLVERGICKYCLEPFTAIKDPNSTFSHRRYYPLPFPKRKHTVVLMEGGELDYVSDEENPMLESFFPETIDALEFNFDVLQIEDPFVEQPASTHGKFTIQTFFTFLGTLGTRLTEHRLDEEF